MEKIKTLTKKIECDFGTLDLRISLVKGSCEDDAYFSSYAVISETDDCVAYAALGHDFTMADCFAEMLFMNDVAPEHLCDIVKELRPLYI